MDIYVLDDELNQIGVIDYYKSLIWSKRYYDIGDCEIYVSASVETLNILQKGYYLMRDDDEMLCRIESIELDTDVENGDFLIVTGYDCRKILNQRIIWNQTNFNGTVENYIRKLITDNIISPSVTARKIDNFQLGASNGFTETIDEQVTYDALDEKIKEICQAYGYGWKITFNPETKIFTFNIYKGKDRSYAQTENDYVVFSSEFDNIISSKYVTDSSNIRNVALVAGEGEGIDRKRFVYGSASGINRYEVYVDAKDISSKTEEGVTINYDEALKARGLEKLAEYDVVTAFEGEVEPNYSYKYKEDYDLGDIVQVVNDYGIEAGARITEVIESHDENGYSVIPTFEYTGV